MPQIGQLAQKKQFRGRWIEEEEEEEERSGWNKKKAEQKSALGKAGLGGVVVINLIWEGGKKRPAEYMIISPHNVEIILSFYPRFAVCVLISTGLFLSRSCRTSSPHLDRHHPPFPKYLGDSSQNSQVTHNQKQKWVFFQFRCTAYEIQTGNECVFASAGPSVCWCMCSWVWVGEWAQPHLQTIYNEPFDLAVFWKNEFPSQ